MKDFIKDIIDINFDMPFEKWCVILVFIFVSVILGTVFGIYIDSWIRYINLF